LNVAATDKKSVLIVLRHSPYGSGLAKAALDVALANAAFEQAVDLLFLGEGVLQLMPGQATDKLGITSTGRQLASLPLYEVNSVYVDREAAEQYRMDLAKAPVATKVLDRREVHQLMNHYDHLLGF
jgi:tRNA 2-thiouridine synthesizing protein C